MSGQLAVRVAAVAVSVAAVAGCGSGAGAPSPSATSSPRASTTASPGASSSPAAAGTAITILAPLGVKLRDAGSPAGTVLGSLGQGTVVTVVAHSDQNGGWYQVRGETQTGWITDDPAYTSPRHFELYQSDASGFSALYLDSWSFTEGPPLVMFRPQSGGYPQIAVATAASIGALGQPGMPGYSTVEVDSAEVFGSTGVLRLLARSGAAPPPTPGQPPLPPLLAELRVTLGGGRAMRLDYLYSTADQLRTFRDFYGSIIVAPSASPAPAAAAPPPATAP